LIVALSAEAVEKNWDVDGVAGLKATSGEDGIGVQREIENRENADCVNSTTAIVCGYS